eukprot:RCo048162
MRSVSCSAQSSPLSPFTVQCCTGSVQPLDHSTPPYRLRESPQPSQALGPTDLISDLLTLRKAKRLSAIFRAASTPSMSKRSCCCCSPIYSSACHFADLHLQALISPFFPTGPLDGGVCLMLCFEK